MLTVHEIRNLKPKDKDYKLSDRDGLYLFITVEGGKYWRFNYRFGEKQKTLAIGTLKNVGLAEAREKLDEARKLLRSEIDPAKAKQDKKRKKNVVLINNFKDFGERWYKQNEAKWAAATARKMKECLALLNPFLGSLNMDELKSGDAVHALHEIEKKTPHMAEKCRQVIGQMVRLSIQMGIRGEGQILDLRGVLKPIPKSNFAAPVGKNEDRLPEILRGIDEYKKENLVVGAALKLQSLLFVRPIELVEMKWEEIKDGCWIRHISKTQIDHVVPLSKQALAILKELKDALGENEFVFASTSKSGHIHRDSLSKALRTLGFQDLIVSHGFRHTASTNLNRMGFDRRAIEIQLGHVDSSISGVYNKYMMLEERKGMMQAYADFLDDEKRREV